MTEQASEPITDLSKLPAILTAEEVAALLRITPQTVKDWCRAGTLPGAFKLPGQKVWRIDRDRLLGWMRKGGDED